MGGAIAGSRLPQLDLARLSLDSHTPNDRYSSVKHPPDTVTESATLRTKVTFRLSRTKLDANDTAANILLSFTSPECIQRHLK